MAPRMHMGRVIGAFTSHSSQPNIADVGVDTGARHACALFQKTALYDNRPRVLGGGLWPASLKSEWLLGNAHQPQLTTTLMHIT